MNIVPQEWDSRFFDLNVGSLVISQSDIFDFDIFKKKSNIFDLIYILSDYKITNLALVDEKEVFIKENIENISYTFENTVRFSSIKHSYKQLLHLTLQTGKYSRFNLDKKFTNNEYNKLYTEWIDKSISKELAFDIFVKLIDNRIVGFITLKEITNKIVGVGLVAVDAEYRGYGIAKELTNRAMYEAKLLGYKSIQVVTQHHNIPAVKLYKAQGFKSKSLTYIYHYWNL